MQWTKEEIKLTVLKLYGKGLKSFAGTKRQKAINELVKRLFGIAKENNFLPLF